MNLSTFEFIKNLADVEGAHKLTSDDLERLHKTLRSILQDFITVCSKENIPFLLSGGTALGAIRHKGFIPWDDDIDINMSRKNLDKFAQVFDKYFPGKYTLCLPGKSVGYHLLLARLRLNNTEYKTHEDFFSKNTGIFIDIFIIENTFNNPLLYKIHGTVCLAAGLLYSCRKFYHEKSIYRQLMQGTPEGKRIFKIKSTMGFFLSFLSLESWIRITDKLHSLCHDENSNYVSIPAGRKHFLGETYEREGFCTPSPIEFEHLTCFISEDHHTYMTKLYGPDYMTPPPKNKREQHIVFALQFPGDLK